MAEGQGHARDKIARYLGVGRTTIEQVEAVVKAAEGLRTLDALQLAAAVDVQHRVGIGALVADIDGMSVQ